MSSKNGSENTTVGNFGLTVDSQHPGLSASKGTHKTTKTEYRKRGIEYRKLVKEFANARDEPTALKLHGLIVKRAQWFETVKLPVNRGPARERKAAKVANDARLSATANSANAGMRERNEKNDLAMARLANANRETKFGKRVVTDCSINSLLHEDVSNFIRDNAPELLTGEYRLKISGMARTQSAIFTVVWRDVDSIAPDGVTVKRSKLWSVFIGDGKGNMIAYDVDTDRPTVNSTLIAAIRPLIASQYKLAPDDGDVLPILIKKTIQSIFG